jgi:hypothetical protein
LDLTYSKETQMKGAVESARVAPRRDEINTKAHPKTDRGTPRIRLTKR